MTVWMYLVGSMIVNIRTYIAWPICLLFAFGIVASGSGGVLCVGHDGHVKVEAICLPSSSGAENPCAPAVIDEVLGEYSDCVGCSDVPLDGPQWLKRSRLAANKQRVESVSAHPVNTIRILSVTESGNSYIATGRSPCCESPPTLCLATTILLC